MSFLLEFLPIIIYILLIIILLVGIIFIIRCLITLDKVDKVVESVNNKIKSLDGIFNIIDTTTDRVVLIADKVIDGLSSLIASFFAPKTEKKVTKKNKKTTKEITTKDEK